MKTYNEQHITINICTDIEEWAKEFYNMPENAVIDNIEEVTSECMGFADVENNIIWIYIPDRHDLKDIKKTIAHEVGHLHKSNIKGGEESKAQYYEDFYMLVDNIKNKVIYNPDNFS